MISYYKLGGCPYGPYDSSQLQIPRLSFLNLSIALQIVINLYTFFHRYNFHRNDKKKKGNSNKCLWKNRIIGVYSIVCHLNPGAESTEERRFDIPTHDKEKLKCETARIISNSTEFKPILKSNTTQILICYTQTYIRTQAIILRRNVYHILCRDVIENMQEYINIDRLSMPDNIDDVYFYNLMYFHL